MLKKNMKLKAAIVLLSIFFTTLFPVSIGITISDSSKVTIITNLDVCHANNSMFFISDNCDISAIPESLCKLCELRLAVFYMPQDTRFSDSLFTFQEDRPPRV
jgi:hypothetical protein